MAVEKQLEEMARMVGLSAPKEQVSLDFDSEFEVSVFEALTKRGFKIDQQVGDSGFRIDLAVRDPDGSDSYALGIECDGRTHRSQFTRPGQGYLAAKDTGIAGLENPSDMVNELVDGSLSGSRKNLWQG